MLNKEESILDEDLLLQGIMDGDLVRVNEYDFYHDDENLKINLEENREWIEDYGHDNHQDIFAEENRKV